MGKVKLFASCEEAMAAIPDGGTTTRQIDGHTLCLVNFRGKLFVMENSCPHLGESLSKGKVNYLGEIVCPWHSYRFSLISGEESQRRCSDLRTYLVSVEEGGLWIEM